MKPERMRLEHPKSNEVRTQQSMKDEVNINSIIKRWRDGVPIPFSHTQPGYGDFSGTVDFHTALNKVEEAKTEFMRLPSELRRECDHDVGVFLDKVHTEEGLKEMIALGLDGALTPPGVVAPKEREVDTKVVEPDPIPVPA